MTTLILFEPLKHCSWDRLYRVIQLQVSFVFFFLTARQICQSLCLSALTFVSFHDYNKYNVAYLKDTITAFFHINKCEMYVACFPSIANLNVYQMSLSYKMLIEISSVAEIPAPIALTIVHPSNTLHLPRQLLLCFYMIPEPSLL